MKKKKLYLDGVKRRLYAVVHLFKTEEEMRRFYKEWCPQDTGHEKVGGVAVNRTYYDVSGGKARLTDRTGEILLSLERCGAGVVSHEIMHAVLWANKFRAHKRQYPIVIKSMKEEEEILRRHTMAVMDFYDWYWKVKKTINVRKNKQA